MLVGHMRVSIDSDRQVLDLQRDALLSAGVDGRHLFEDRASGTRGDRTGLAKALAFIHSGDCLVVWKLELNKSASLPAPSTNISLRNGTAGAMPLNCKTGFGFVRLEHARLRNSRRGCCQRPSRMTGWPIGPAWSWRSASSAGSFFRGQQHSNASAPRCVITPGGRCVERRRSPDIAG